MTKGFLATLASLAVLLFGAASAGAAQNSLAVGIYPNYPPLDMRDPATNKLKGFDVDLGNHIAQKLGQEIVWKETAFPQLIASIQTGRIALFFNGMDDTPERQKIISFVDYLKSGTQFMTLSANKAAFSSAASLCGKKVAASRGTNIPQQVAAWSKAHCIAQGKPAIVFLDADNNIDARSQLKQGRVDAMAQDSLTIPYIQNQEPGTYLTVGEPFDYTIMGIGVGKADTALQARIVTALQGLMDDGTYARLLRKWGLPPSSGMTKVTVNLAP